MPPHATHGEPHPGNIIWTPSGARFIDLGTVRVAPPDRDLWMLTTAFTSLIGVEPVAAYVGDLRQPHGDGEDAAAALSYLTGYLGSAND